MWMDDVQRNIARKAKAESLPADVRKKHEDQYAAVCMDLAIAVIVGIAEGLTGKPQYKNEQLREYARGIADAWCRNGANEIIVRVGEVCACAENAANRMGCVDTGEEAPFSPESDQEWQQARFIRIASACDAYTAAFARNCEDFGALDVARRKLKAEV